MSDDPPAVSIVGDASAISELEPTLLEVGLDVESANVVSGLRPPASDVVVAIGERAVVDVATSGLAAPVIPVGAGPGIRSVPRDDIDALPAAITAEDWELEHHVPLSVSVDGETVGTAVFDVTLVTAAAARISEYEVYSDGDVLDRSRADGVVIATPAGSTDYARRVDAPVQSPGTGAAVAWIAPFHTNPDHWVVDPGALSIHVQRDEASVDLVVDERVTRTVGPENIVSVTPTEQFEVAVLDASRHRHG